ncbi:MAG: hypothetical protein M3065_04095 [Actinomycetota bacterium]|nr:hypothetical protein [Actinomycetota bacterium]
MTTVSSFSGLMIAGGAALGGVVHDPLALIIVFTAINLNAASAAIVLSKPADEGVRSR